SSTLWMLDLLTGSAGAIFSSARLQGVNGYADNGFAPHFVHAPSSWATTVPGSTPPAMVAAVPTVMFAEALAPATPAGFAGDLRLYYAVYSSSPTVPAPVAIDQL